MAILSQIPPKEKPGPVWTKFNSNLAESLMLLVGKMSSVILYVALKLKRVGSMDWINNSMSAEG